MWYDGNITNWSYKMFINIYHKNYALFYISHYKEFNCKYTPKQTLWPLNILWTFKSPWKRWLYIYFPFAKGGYASDPLCSCQQKSTAKYSCSQACCAKIFLCCVTHTGKAQAVVARGIYNAENSCNLENESILVVIIPYIRQALNGPVYHVFSSNLWQNVLIFYVNNRIHKEKIK